MNKTVILTNQDDVDLIGLTLSKNTKPDGYSIVLDFRISGQKADKEKPVIQYIDKNYAGCSPLKPGEEEGTTRDVLRKILCYLYLSYGKNNILEGYQYIGSEGTTNVRNIVESNLLTGQFHKIIKYSIIGKNAMLSDFGLVSFHEGIDIERARYVNYILCEKEIRKMKQYFMDIEDNEIAKIIQTKSISSFVKSAKDTRNYLEKYVKGIKDAIRYKVYGNRYDEEILQNGITVLDNFINNILDNCINIAG